MEYNEHKRLMQALIDQARSYEYKSKIEIISGSCCPACNKSDGKLIPVEKIIEPPVPNPKCKREGGCNCTLAIVGVRDKNGRLVKKKIPVPSRGPTRI